MQITDPSAAPQPFFTEKVAGILNDPRDATLVALITKCGLLAVLGVSLYFLPIPLWYAAPVYWLLLSFVMDRFTLMLHCTSHRQLFRSKHGFLNHLIPTVLGPFFGQTPNTYFAHHMGMHHREENLADDLSSTLRFQRDRFGHFLRYWSRFLAFGVVDLYGYFRKRGQHKMMRRVLAGETSYFALVLLLLLLNPVATFIVFVAPFLAIRTLMMMGNWTQHSFVCQEHPEDPYRASITCINTRYNQRCFNDGYHILHHIKPRCHWTEHPVEFERAIDEYGKHDAIVFDGLDYFEIWLCLMTGRWGKLARHFVQLPSAPRRSPDEVIAFLRERVQPVKASVEGSEPALTEAAPV